MEAKLLSSLSIIPVVMFLAVAMVGRSSRATRATGAFDGETDVGNAKPGGLVYDVVNDE